MGTKGCNTDSTKGSLTKGARIKNNIIAPKLISQNYKKNYIEIQDLGKKNIYQILSKNKKNQYKIYTKTIKNLYKIQLLTYKQIKNNKKKNNIIKIYKIKIYIYKQN